MSTAANSINADRQELEEIWPVIAQDLIEYVHSFTGQETSDWFKRVLEYNLTMGKIHRALLAHAAYKNLVAEKTPANLKLSQILAWCLELQQSFFIMIDDIMDESITRRKKLCWHKVDNVGFQALNDAQMLQHSIFYLLKKYFLHLECCRDLVNLFHESLNITISGQYLDLLIGKQNVATFTRDKVRNIALNKGAFYSFYVPVALAMHLAGCKDIKAFEETKTILLELGVLFQNQDDYLDIFSSTKVTGKIGTDIKNNKCTWLAAECMHRGNEAQKAIMMKCYGSSDPEKIARVEQLYRDMELPTIYEDYAKKMFQKIKQQLEQTSKNVPKEAILNMATELDRRAM